jgi:hypothetical protein
MRTFKEFLFGYDFELLYIQCFGIERYLRVLTTAKVRAILVSLIKSIDYTIADKYKPS